MDQVDQDYLQEILKSGGETSEQDLKNDVKVIEDDTTYEEILVSVWRYKIKSIFAFPSFGHMLTFKEVFTNHVRFLVSIKDAQLCV